MGRHPAAIGAAFVVACFLAPVTAGAQGNCLDPNNLTLKPGCVSSDPEQRARQKEFLVDEAMRFVQLRDWDHAIRSLEDALAVDPDDDNTRLWLRRAEAEGARSWMIEDVRIEGDVVLFTPDGRQYPGRRMVHVPLDNKSRITIAPAGRLAMLLPDGTTFTMAGAAGGAEIMLDGFVYQPDSHKLTYLLEVASGDLRYVSGSSNRPRLAPFPANPPRPQIPARVQYMPQIRTPSGALQLLGTDVECNIDPDGTGVITIYEGPATFREKGTTEAKTLTAGQTIRFAGDRVVEIR
jgi:hypothetical protein